MIYYLFKTFFVAGMIGMHHPVPKVKIKAVVALYKPVVHIMMGGSIMPFKQPVAGKAFGEKLVTKVAQNIQQQGI